MPPVNGDDLYNFLDGTAIRRIPVNADMRAALGDGRLMIARCDGRYHVVPSAVAQRIRERDERAVMATNSAPKPPDEDDPYKDYVVPDDLIW
jgi:uncharacterized protein YaiL (DUF2058 family)